jgi:uncharacterized protein (TIGR02145 family)
MNVSIKSLAVADDLKIISKFVPGTIARTNPIILFILSMFFAYSCERDNTYMDIDSMPEPGDSSIVYLPSETFTIVSGDQLVQKRSLANKNQKYLKNFILRVQNGISNRTKAQSVEVLVDGNRVITASDFINTNIVSKQLPALSPSSNIEVRLSGQQGAFVKLRVEGSLQRGVISDNEGNYYHTIKIGSNTWTVENLRTTKYNNGTPLQYVTDDKTWANMDVIYTGSYCYYNNDSAYKETYGTMYNWVAAGNVEEREICPVGWHVSTFEDLWDAILVYDPKAPYIYERNVGSEFKETGTTHWESPNTGATNHSGFTGLPGGSRDSTFSGLGKSGVWWLGYGERFGLMYNNTRIGYIYDVYSGAHSVRCVKDR